MWLLFSFAATLLVAFLFFSSSLLSSAYHCHSGDVHEERGKCGLEEQSEVQLVVPVGSGGVVRAKHLC